MKTVQVLEDSNILLKRITKTIKNKTTDPKEGFLGMLLDTLGACLLANMLTWKGTVRAGYGHKERNRIVRVGYGYKEYSIKDFQFF